MNSTLCLAQTLAFIGEAELAKRCLKESSSKAACSLGKKASRVIKRWQRSLTFRDHEMFRSFSIDTKVEEWIGDALAAAERMGCHPGNKGV